MRPCCAFLAALLVAACSSGGSAPRGSARQVWAAALCGGLDTLLADQQTLTARFRSEATALVSRPAASRELLATALEAVRVDFTAAVGTLQGVGPPAVAAGRSVQAAALTGLREGEALYAGATSRVRATAANGPALVVTLNGIRADLASGGAALTTAFDGLDAQDRSGRLTQAFRSEPTCVGVTG